MAKQDLDMKPQSGSIDLSKAAVLVIDMQVCVLAMFGSLNRGWQASLVSGRLALLTSCFDFLTLCSWSII